MVSHLVVSECAAGLVCHCHHHRSKAAALLHGEAGVAGGFDDKRFEGHIRFLLSLPQSSGFIHPRRKNRLLHTMPSFRKLLQRDVVVIC